MQSPFSFGKGHKGMTEKEKRCWLSPSQVQGERREQMRSETPTLAVFCEQEEYEATVLTDHKAQYEPKANHDLSRTEDKRLSRLFLQEVDPI
jgi:hypothetical protein